MLRKKCVNLIHNKYLLERKLNEKASAAIKIQAWVRGHIVRKRMEEEYIKLM
jgi:hypothetical protein